MGKFRYFRFLQPKSALLVMVSSALLASSVTLADEQPTPTRQVELMTLLRHDCGSCHGLTMKGGLGPPLLPDTLAGKDKPALVGIILDGVPGKPMPPWRFELQPEEARWLVDRLREGLK
ncbi:cytochrome c [Skermanella rosea]|uniref:c-type cytochrome n=1 Tax=Skermanella rosea TaxID=1817965 RepID=UPI001E5B36AB|nr:cytochrome c [Skermanella rosea]UEM03413.1 cytochrome c [Skermanella rosea]